MIPSVLKSLFVPGSALFFLFAATFGTLLLYRRKDGGRLGRIWLTALVVSYWLLSMPLTAVAIIRALSPEHPPIAMRADARGATAIVVLGSGMDTYRSRGALMNVGTREHTLRLLEAARVYRLLDRPWVIVTGSLQSNPRSEAFHMAEVLESLGVPADRIVREGKSTNTHDHTRYVPPLLAERGVKRFVLVTSRQHMARALQAFRAAGLDPVPSAPEFYVAQGGWLEAVTPSKAALEASTAMMYDAFAIVYYKLRGWV